LSKRFIFRVFASTNHPIEILRRTDEARLRQCLQEVVEQLAF
jgi:hypothetical protein